MKLQFFELLASIGFVPSDIQIPRRGNAVDKVAAFSGTQVFTMFGSGQHI